MIDRAARDTAAPLIRQFRDGALTNDDLDDQWPQKSQDDALAPLADMLWRYYDDHRVHKLIDLHSDVAADLSRYAAFLETDLPYEWPDKDFGAIDLLCIARTSKGNELGVLTAQNKRRVDALMLSGDVAVWPFIRADDVP